MSGAATMPLERAPVTGAAVAPWRILLVDDSADDTELICLELAQAGIDAECRCVDSEVQLLEALLSFAPHLVLSDVNMPGFSGQRAIALVRAHAPTARFVFISGEALDTDPASTEPVAEAWLSKNHLDQLPQLVRRLLA